MHRPQPGNYPETRFEEIGGDAREPDVSTSSARTRTQSLTRLTSVPFSAKLLRCEPALISVDDCFANFASRRFSAERGHRRDFTTCRRRSEFGRRPRAGTERV